MDNETRAELIEQVEAYRAVDEMVKTTGWQKFVIPRIEKMKDLANSQLLNKTAYREIIRAQEKIKAIDSILLDLMMDIKDGEAATEELAKDKQE